MAVNSMTGYGKGFCEKDGLKLIIELKSVNHRFLDLSIKLPKNFNFIEEIVRKKLKDNFSRGHFDVFLSYEDNRQDKNSISFDYALAESYYLAAKKMEEDMFVKNNVGAYELLSFPNVVTSSIKEEDEEFLLDIVNVALDDAIEKINIMRITEGKAMESDIVSKIETISNITEEISKLVPSMVSEHFEKVKDRISEMLKDVSIDESKMLNEVAFYSDKVCVDEEIQRLRSHVLHFNEIINKGGVCGKQLDFIVQEMNREANTCGSKCNNISVSNLVISLKNEIEKVREQIQNIE